MSDTDLLKTAEVAERLNVSRDKVLQLINDGSLPSIRLGPKTIRVLSGEIDKLITRISTETVQAQGGMI